MRNKAIVVFCSCLFYVMPICAGILDNPVQSLPIKDTVTHKNRIFSPNIRTVQVYPDGWEFSMPVIRLDSDEKLRLAFDDMDGDYVEYYYRYLHCDENWVPSDMNRNLYLSGYTENTITEYEYSRNTLQTYTHYELVFPDDDMQILRSGNYLIQVYRDNSGELSFEVQFCVVEENIVVHAGIIQPSGINDQYNRQEMKLSLEFINGFNPHIPEANIHPRIFQNGSSYNCLTSLKPVSVSNNFMSYDLPGKILFDGGNEFRNFDAKNLDYLSEFIRSIDTENDTIQVFLKPDKKKNVQAYKSDPDINGKYLVKNDKANNPATESEYINVHFYFPSIVPLAGSEIYLNGALTGWEMNDNSRLVYNYQEKGYGITLFLKQGYYNYQYVLFDSFTKKYDISAYEGSFYETENEYSVFVYYHDLIENYDRLAGYKTIRTSTH